MQKRRVSNFSTLLFKYIKGNQMTREDVHEFIKNNNDKLGIDLHWIGLYTPSANRELKEGESSSYLSRLCDFYDVMVNSSLEAKLVEAERMVELTKETDWAIINEDIFRKTLLLSELKAGSYGTDNYSVEYKGTIEYLKKVGVTFEAPSKKHEVKTMTKTASRKTHKAKRSRYQEMMNK